MSAATPREDLMNKRLAMLESLTSSGKADAFAWYGLGMEYRREGRREDAIRTFEQLRSQHPDYLPVYLMAGQTLVEAARTNDARDWLSAGIKLAQSQGNSHALGELEGALDNLL
jgi:predicted Zn-dependent protease